MPEDKSLDILGIKPIAESINTVTKGVVDGASAFLGRICLPAAEEFGLLLRDRVSHYRGMHATRIAAKAERILKEQNAGDVHAHPRLVSTIIEQGSWIEDDEVQEMWAGLLASSCTEDGMDDSNIIFTHLLAQLTKLEARVLNYACENAEKYLSDTGLILARELNVNAETLVNLTGCEDIHRLDRELDHIRSLDLLHPISAGFDTRLLQASEADVQSYNQKLMANITPTGLALNLYTRCQGSNENPTIYYKIALA